MPVHAGSMDEGTAGYFLPPVLLLSDSRLCGALDGRCHPQPARSRKDRVGVASCRRKWTILRFQGLTGMLSPSRGAAVPMTGSCQRSGRGTLNKSGVSGQILPCLILPQKGPPAQPKPWKFRAEFFRRIFRRMVPDMRNFRGFLHGHH
jgi:hypothetical protein